MNIGTKAGRGKGESGRVHSLLKSATQYAHKNKAGKALDDVSRKAITTQEGSSISKLYDFGASLKSIPRIDFGRSRVEG